MALLPQRTFAGGHSLTNGPVSQREHGPPEFRTFAHDGNSSPLFFVISAEMSLLWVRLSVLLDYNSSYYATS